MNLSKGFDTLSHDWLMAKLEAYWFSKNSLNCIQGCLGNCLERTNVNNNFTLWKYIFAGVPKGSILGPLMFNIYIRNLFPFSDNACLNDYDDDTTLYSIEENQH